jgi:hypothetical protein
LTVRLRVVEVIGGDAGLLGFGLWQVSLSQSSFLVFAYCRPEFDRPVTGGLEEDLESFAASITP